jgi:8-oxo-dGTP pyrophosphatase MutT (NUDIX family)
MSAHAPGVLARGPWPLERIEVCWRREAYEPAAVDTHKADRAIDELAARGSPSHDGLAARLADWQAAGDGLRLELQPMRWALRLGADAAGALSALCVIRSADGRWLAGRRAAWVASWAGRWALGAGGSVELDESPVDTLRRELEEEWAVTPERFSAEALVLLPSRMWMFVGQAWLAEGAQVTPDPEHDAYAWWPDDVDAWPAEAGEELRRLGRLLSAT